jgi:LPS O-antigen subunit length determinant protein (WzzB/FepE family)
MKPEVNAVLQEVKAQLANPQPTMPDFKAMSIMEATKWCIEKGITSPKVIAQTTGKKVNTVNTALWKIRNPKRVKMLSRRAKKVRDLKAGIVKEGVKVAKVAKVAKPKITNGQYDDGMDTPWRDAVMRRGGNFDFLQKQPEESGGVHYLKGEVDRLRKEVQRLTIIVEYYEGKAGK